MKSLQFALRAAAAVCIAFFMSSASCELFDKVDDVTFDLEIEHTFSVDASENDPLSYSEIETIDPTLDADFNKYKDKIKEITIQSVEYTVTNYEGDPGIVFTNGNGKFIGTGTSGLATASLAIQNISASQGNTYTLDYTISDLDAIASELENLKEVKFEVSGNISGVPVKFNVPITIKMTIVADAL